MGKSNVNRTALGLAALFIALIAAGCGLNEKGRVPVTTSSKEALSLYRDGVAFLEQVQIEKARICFEKAVALDSTFAMAYYQMAFTCFDAPCFLNNLSRAKSLADKASEGEKLKVAITWEGNNGNAAKAMESCRKLVELYPNDRDAHISLAGFLNGQEKYEEAAAEYQKAVTVDPSYAMGYNVMAYGYMNAGRLEEAEKTIQKYIGMKPAEPNPYDSRGDILRKAGRFDESSDSYRKALSIDSLFLSSYRGIGINLALQGKADEAAAEFDRAIAKAPDDGQKQFGMSCRAFGWILAGRTEKAEADFAESLAISKKNGDVAGQVNDLGMLGWTAAEKGRMNKTARNNKIALALVEGSSLSSDLKSAYRAQFLFSDADLALRKGQFKAARQKAEAFKQALAGMNDLNSEKQYHNLLGAVALGEKRYDDAIRELGQARQRNCEVLYRLAEAHLAKGDKATAKEFFSKVANFNEYDWNFAFLRAKAQKKLAGL
jgi:tetratricopeptide (TPR) repeat protein